MRLNFPTYNFKIKRQENSNYVFDIIRKKFVLLTPEEWVRQHTLNYLIHDLHCPSSLIAVERGLEVNGLRKRFDLMVYQQGKPFLLVECKAPTIRLHQPAAMQIAVYNSHFNCRYLWLTNGLDHYYYEIQADGKPNPIPMLPDFMD
ncbi:MAG: type I restriction enzyme HsdR N-terminal domain-containing protein [Bacteroidia bacterium]|jgi:hypothetical protein